MTPLPAKNEQMDQHHHQENCTELLFVNRRRQADQGAIVPFFVGHMLSGSDFIENCIDGRRQWRPRELLAKRVAKAGSRVAEQQM